MYNLRIYLSPGRERLRGFYDEIERNKRSFIQRRREGVCVLRGRGCGDVYF